jgi:hypothetical protein
MATPQLKPIEERNPYAAMVLDAFDRMDTEIREYRIPESPECKECRYPMEHERIRIFKDGACHVWSCGNAFCSKWNLITNTDAVLIHYNVDVDATADEKTN